MSVIFRGTILPQLQKRSIVYSPTSGYIRTWDYKSFSEELMLNLMNQYTGAGCEVTLSGEHGIFTLQVRDSTGEITLDTWQIQQSDERPTCLDNPRNVANTTIREREIIKRAITNGISPDLAMEQLNNETSYTYFYLTPGGYAENLYNRMNEGTTEFTRSIFILRHTTNAPSNYSANVADANVDCIYTVNQLLTETGNRNYWRLPLPPRLVAKIQNIVFPAYRDFSLYGNYQNGWLKRGSSESTAANFRIEITTEYWMGQISNDEYDYAVL